MTGEDDYHSLCGLLCKYCFNFVAFAITEFFSRTPGDYSRIPGDYSRTLGDYLRTPVD